MINWRRYVEERMGWVISHLWHLIGQDVESTTYNVARKYVNDPDEDPDVLRRRAEALYSISHMFGVRATRYPSSLLWKILSVGLHGVTV